MVQVVQVVKVVNVVKVVKVVRVVRMISLDYMNSENIQGGFFDWSAQISVLKRKTLFNQ